MQHNEKWEAVIFLKYAVVDFINQWDCLLLEKPHPCVLVKLLELAYLFELTCKRSSCASGLQTMFRLNWIYHMCIMKLCYLIFFFFCSLNPVIGNSDYFHFLLENQILMSWNRCCSFCIVFLEYKGNKLYLKHVTLLCRWHPILTAFFPLKAL